MSISQADRSVLAHMVFGCGVGIKPEDATTEALVYVLNRSDAVRRRFHELVCSLTGLRLAPVQRYETQVTQGDGQRPDIVGFSAVNQQVLLVENKFWADLTDNQPVAYLNVLENSQAGLVLFVCPTTRLDLLWRYLLDRLHRVDIKIETDSDGSLQKVDQRFVMLQGKRHALACISWNYLLREFRQAAQDANDGSTSGDLMQISGLIAQIDEDNPFLPLRDDDLTQSKGRMFVSLQEIDKLLRFRICSTSNYYLVRKDNTWVNSLDAKISWFIVGISLDMWAKWGCSPFWVTIGAWEENPDYCAIKLAVTDWLVEGPHRAVEGRTQDNNLFIAFPIIPPLGVERDTVVKRMAEDALKIVSLVEKRLVKT